MRDKSLFHVSQRLDHILALLLAVHRRAPFELENGAIRANRDIQITVFSRFLEDEQGWSHSMQVHPDRSADYVRFSPAQLNKCNRWIVRTTDQQALGFAMPSTAEPEGYTAEKAKGNIKVIPGEGKVSFKIVAGYMNPVEAQAMEAKVEKIIASARS